MYWVYNLPNWFFEWLTISLFVAFSLAGLLPSRRWVARVHVQHSHNDIVGFYLAAITVLYGVTLGLLAIGAWTTYVETEATVAREAAALGSVYRSVGDLPQPARGVLQNDLRTYAHQIIYIGWPEQRQGILPTENRATLNKFHHDLQTFEPATESQKITDANVAQEMEALEAARSIRLDSVTEELPTPLWTLILAGGLICIIVTWFFHMESLSMHIWMTILFSGLLGLMVFMVAALDNPYRGKISVGPDPLVRVYGLMNNPNK